MVQISSLVAVVALGVLSSAHPGQSDKEKRAEAAARKTYLDSLEKTNLAHCAPKLASRGVVQRSIARRTETLATLRKRAGIVIDESNKS
jgi:hypothetical protein